jgi:hypothetical protein
MGEGRGGGRAGLFRSATYFQHPRPHPPHPKRDGRGKNKVWLPLGLCLLLLPACSGLPTYGLFLPQVDNSTLHAEVFQESYRRISVFYLEPVALDRLAVAGLNGPLRT